MSLKQYFESTKGFGVLSTSDREGNVDAAIYARPHIMEDGSVAMIMRDRLSHSNLQLNPRATFLFKQEGDGYRGKRLFLTKLREEKNSELLKSLKRRKTEHGNGEDRFLVFFKVDRELPLVGTGK